MPESELILCIETSSKLLSIALWQDGVVLDNINHIGAKVHNEHLLSSIKKILENSNFSLNNLTGIACGIGPGSFTGLRIGCAAIQGLAFSLNIPVYTCSSLRLIAQEYYLKNKNKNKNKNKILIIQDANAGDFYIGNYIIKNNLAVSLDINLDINLDFSLCSDILLNKKNVIDYINNNNFDAYIGDAAGEFSISNNNSHNSHNSNNIYYPTALALCELLPELIKFPIDAENLEPIYLRTDKHWQK